jgi:hypothetical protein
MGLFSLLPEVLMEAVRLHVLGSVQELQHKCFF